MPALQRLGRLWLAETDLGDFAVRAVVVPGRDRVVVWDTLAHPAQMAPLLPLIRGRELVVVYSHADWDHIWGTVGLPETGRTIVGHERCRARFALEAPATLAEMIAADPDRWRGVHLLAPTLTFARELAIDLGGSMLVLRHLPGHTVDSIVGFLPEEGVLLAGDAVETPLPQVPAGCELDRWLEELCRWQEDPRVRTVVPSHGPVGGPELLADNIAYLRRLLAGGEMAMPEGLSPFYRASHLANLRARGKGR